MLKYKGYAIVMNEVPDEISLAINISGCKHHCEGCHSEYLWDDDGFILKDDFDRLIFVYKKYISCICFMGGDQDQEELADLCYKAHKADIKTCLYTACHVSGLINSLLDELDYVKTGRFIKEKGPLNDPRTNQRMYRKEIHDGIETWIDITHMFWKKYAEKKERK